MQNQSLKRVQFSSLLLVILCLSSVTVNSQKTVQDIIDAGTCNNGSAVSGLSNQIMTLAQKKSICYFSDISNVAELDGKSPIQIAQIIERNTANEIEIALQSKNQKLSLTYGLVGLPEFYIFNELFKKNSACAPQEFINLLSTTYSSCKLCSGNAFYTRSADQLSVFNDKFNVFNIDSNNLITVNTYNPDFKKLFVEAFQLQWNCNNPNDNLQVTGNFDMQTEQKLKLAPVDGFQDICMKCDIQNCGRCTADFKSCKECKSGFTLNPDGTCTNCQDKNCLSCTHDDKGNDICNKCSAGFVLLDGTCITTCPSGYTQTETNCLQCKVGQYGSGNQCIDCDKYCKVCTGPKATDCQSCFDGFIKDPNGGCKTCPTGQCCGSTKCADDEYRQTVYPYECQKCSNNCATCTGPDAKQCLSCINGYVLDGGFCMNPSKQLNTYLDTKTNTNKPCHFSCEECVDSSSLCTKCKIDFNYFLQIDSKFKCFTQCPTDYEPENGLSSTDFVKCVVKSDLSVSEIQTQVLIETAKQRCITSQYFNTDQKQCVSCATNCLSCSDSDNCDQCTSGMYWNQNTNTCSPCHSSCTSCSGPSHKECLKCKDIKNLYTNNGVCDSMASTPVSSITTPQANQFKSSNLFDTNSQLYNVRLGVSQFTTQNPIWMNESLVDSNQCTFASFKQYYTSLNDPNISCNDSQIKRSTMSTKGSMTAIYAMILSLSGVQLDGKSANPSSLAKYAIANQKYNIFYGFNVNDEFSCDQLICESSLESYLSDLTAFNNVKVSIKQARDVPITSQGASINCFSDNYQVDDDKIQTVDMLVLFANQSLKTSHKQYFILDVCGKDQTSQSVIQKQYFVSNYFGNGFFETVGVHLPEGQQTQVFYIGGADKNQNDFAKKSNPKYLNNFESYKVQKVRVIEVEELDASIDKVDQSYAQAVANAKLESNIPSKCNCITNTVDYIIANEGNNNQLIPIITPDNQFLAKSIDAFSIKYITSQFNLDLDSMKANNLSITSAMAKKIFTKVVEQSISDTSACYGLDKSINQCLQNALIDISFSNRQKCVNEKEIKAYVLKSDYQGVIQSIQSSQWCSINSERCAKNIQIIKSCL
ncbi:proprotein convertase subtilisin/kexin type 5 (macronuclear) [Tetrahymena thermophila SB210]|uniref:Proprotein convertase subtilisin/kexin type 5 n=1 Tax=Tetrahymena thermophila (strain SB210) TaxID=312017 RepID=Q23R75_TETTS|nr:proprotein convertase subtilisin/kexin type 5 [Tetrahymena thermophila SB210]EAR99173.1 proprotein convertase subtilisin/kexin type 5 [Tetrahymena thermophila SB210]|eukprot:XP_001019418.1 proprotein convertase subtilisin/kexin type 5 [Tetrahymena thermophila SB210]